MNVEVIKLMVILLQNIFPYIKRMAQKTDNKIDDVIVDLFARIIENIDLELKTGDKK